MNIQVLYQTYTQFNPLGKELVSKYSLDTEGVWKVLGEDPNSDFCGTHKEPFLGHFTGKLEDVIYAALSTPGFVGIGHGGRILLESGPNKPS